MVRMLTCYSDDPSSNPAKANNCTSKILFEMNENMQKKPGLVHLKRIFKCYDMWYNGIVHLVERLLPRHTYDLQSESSHWQFEFTVKCNK